MVALLAALAVGPTFSVEGFSEGEAGQYPSVSVSRDGRIVVYRGARRSEVRRDGKALRSLPSGRASYGAPAPALSPDGRLIAYDVEGGRLVVEETLSGKRVAEAALRSRGRLGRGALPAEAIAFSPDGKTVAVAYGVLYHHWLAFLDLPRGPFRATALDEFDGGSSRLAWSPDGRLLAGGDGVGFVLRRDGSALLRPPLLAEQLGAARDIPRGPTVRSVRAFGPFFRRGRPYAGDAGGAFSLDAGAGTRPDGGAGALRVAVAPDGAWAARRGDDGAVEAFRPAERAFETGAKPFARFPAEPGARPVASGEGRWLVISRGVGFDVYDMKA